ncbi:O-antigen ligase family protein [Thermoflavimicrobium daqui]|uniref:O-antigen ligase family protein n=1 Tax=Thermoflavimicrobium daqui TaxID=2137476 RepID=UPI00143CDEF6|nr:O-antigen ligase family protein [Thermoflavimicrobium daqui]
MNLSLFLRQERLETIFYCMVAFALLGPTLGVPVTEDFNLTFFRFAFILLSGGLLWRITIHKDFKAFYMYPIRWYTAFFVFWFLYGLCSITWAVNMGAAVHYLIFLVMMLSLTLSIPYFVTSEEKYWKISRILLGVFAFIVYFAVFEGITGVHLPSSGVFAKSYPSNTITSVFTNQNDLATCITLALPFLIAALLILSLTKKVKWFLYITIVFSLFTLIATGSRVNTALVLPILVILFAVLIPFVIERAKLTKKNVFKTITAAIIAVLLAICMSSLLIHVQKSVHDPRAKILSSWKAIQDIKPAMEAAKNKDKKVVRGETGESITVRLNLLLNGLKFLQKSHFMGVGAGNIEPLMKGAPRVNKVNMHNWWAEVLVNFGVIIFILYISLYIWLCWRLWKLAWLKSSPYISPLIRWGAISSLIAMIGFVGGGVAPSTAIHYTPMWVVYGIALAVIILGETQQKKRESINI